MILECPSCETRFLVDSALIPAAGREVKCARCDHQWMVYGAVEDAASDTSATAEEPEGVTVDALPNMPEVPYSHEDQSFEMPFAPSMPAVVAPKFSPMPLMMTALCLFLVVVGVALFAFRHNLQDSLGGIYSMIGLESSEGLALADVVMRTRPSRTKARFVVEGKIINESKEKRKVPVLRVTIADKDGKAIAMREYEADDVIEAGESYPFKAGNLETTFVDKVDHLIVDIGNDVALSLTEPQK